MLKRADSIDFNCKPKRRETKKKIDNDRYISVYFWHTEEKHIYKYMCVVVTYQLYIH